jgi:2-keto-4-pentenoate hydratase/2-oxohepta-3-ene-1,7-dioic acid hydratase in catechol pathway
MWRWRIGLIMLVAGSLLSTGTPAFVGPGRKVGPPPTPPGQAVDSPGEAEGRHVGPVETAPGQAKEKPKKGKQKVHAKQHPPADGVPTE